jgi:hypothetical protein
MLMPNINSLSSIFLSFHINNKIKKKGFVMNESKKSIIFQGCNAVQFKKAPQKLGLIQTAQHYSPVLFVVTALRTSNPVTESRFAGSLSI